MIARQELIAALPGGRAAQSHMLNPSHSFLHTKLPMSHSRAASAGLGRKLVPLRPWRGARSSLQPGSGFSSRRTSSG